MDRLTISILVAMSGPSGLFGPSTRDCALLAADEINQSMGGLLGSERGLATEIMRPQGTLYGKNTIGGAINIISTRPDTEQFSAKLRANIGNYERTDFAGLLTGPISENLAGKFSFSYRNRDGWVDNVVLNKKQKDDDVQAYRGQLLYTSEDTEIMFTADYNKLDVEDMARIPQTQIVGGLGPLVDQYDALCGNRGPKCSTNPSDGFAKRDAWGVSLHVTHDFGIGELKSISAYRENEVDWEMDSVGVDRVWDDCERL